VRTQVSLIRRLTVVVIAVLAIAGMLLTFPSARAAGTSILASAGVISIVAGLAAQTSLANVFAGLQLAFTDAIRVDDVVVIEEITLTYVVVHVWDDRRLVLSSTSFTTTPFQNWPARSPPSWARWRWTSTGRCPSTRCAPSSTGCSRASSCGTSG
jgi:small-conductance mechanosensitive channel